MKGHPFTPKIEDDHSCQIRRSFHSQAQAKVVADSIYARTGKKRPVERCRHCSGWHLGESV